MAHKLLVYYLGIHGEAGDSRFKIMPVALEPSASGEGGEDSGMCPRLG
jgi:hypothetical protein